MLYYVILRCSLPHSILFDSTRLNSILFYSTLVYSTLLYSTLLYYMILYYTILYYTVLYCTILYVSKSWVHWRDSKRGPETTPPQSWLALALVSGRHDHAV